MKNNVRTLNDCIVREKVKKHDTEKISFLSHISHGIRTPLNSIMGFSKLLGLRSVIDPKQKEYIHGILEGSNLLLQFVDNIMDLSQFEAKNYSLNIKKHDINQILWEFTEDFYEKKIENTDSNTNIMLVWDTKEKDLEIETDSSLLKKALLRIVALASTKYPMEEFELGYRLTENKSINIYVRPAKENLSSNELLNEHEFYLFDENNSFDYFNYKVLSSSLSILGGELSLNSENQEFSMLIPVKFDRSKDLI